MSFANELLLETKSIWEEYLKHPFVVGLADGSLDLAKFRFYMIQDYLYLKEYIKVFAQGLCHAHEEEDLRLFAASCQAVVAEIDRVHKPYMKRIGITEEEITHATACIENLGYTSYMIQAATFGDETDAFVAILSCAWSYAWIAKEMMQKYPEAARHEFYGEWFEGYAAEEYIASTEALIQRVDELSEGLSQERRKKLVELFKNCSLYEKQFWDMGWNEGRIES